MVFTIVFLFTFRGAGSYLVLKSWSRCFLQLQVFKSPGCCYICNGHQGVLVFPKSAKCIFITSNYCFTFRLFDFCCLYSKLNIVRFMARSYFLYLKQVVEVLRVANPGNPPRSLVLLILFSPSLGDSYEV